jgi:hypothetical protein
LAVARFGASFLGRSASGWVRANPQQHQQPQQQQQQQQRQQHNQQQLQTNTLAVRTTPADFESTAEPTHRGFSSGVIARDFDILLASAQRRVQLETADAARAAAFESRCRGLATQRNAAADAAAARAETRVRRHANAALMRANRQMGAAIAAGRPATHHPSTEEDNSRVGAAAPRSMRQLSAALTRAQADEGHGEGE